jgi:hypothetical protein
MIDPNVVVKNMESADSYIAELLNKIKTLEKQIEEYDEDIQFLDCLRACGVDNWEGYDEALKMMRENDEV